MQDDPFERAARREAASLWFRDNARRRGGDAAWALVGIQLAWAVLLGVHWWVADGTGRPLAIHTTIFVVALASTIFLTIASLARPRWTMFALVGGWLPLLVLHWVLAGGRTRFVTIHTVFFSFALAFAIMTLFATPRRSRSSSIF